ncbi:hypothetical protein SEA_TRIUMPH_2 [Streptomyces phage Triumph]|nr:hypothetical protein SEA_TRIUMPH_2 [Streptomyces phage Triumph]
MGRSAAPQQLAGSALWRALRAPGAALTSIPSPLRPHQVAAARRPSLEGFMCKCEHGHAKSSFRDEGRAPYQ